MVFSLLAQCKRVHAEVRAHIRTRIEMRTRVLLRTHAEHKITRTGTRKYTCACVRTHDAHLLGCPKLRPHFDIPVALPSAMTCFPTLPLFAATICSVYELYTNEPLLFPRIILTLPRPFLLLFGVGGGTDCGFACELVQLKRARVSLAVS